MTPADAPIWELPEDAGTVDGLDQFGEPDPAYAAALGLVPAPLGRRAAAGAVDVVVYLLLQVPALVFTLPLVLSLLTGRISWYGFVNHPDFLLAVVMASVTTVLTIAYCVLQLVLHGRSGLTLGKGMLGIRSVNVKTLAKPGFWLVTLRAAMVWGSGVIVVGPLVFFLSPLFDPQRRGRGWHDVVGQTWLVDVRRGLQPYDKKRMRIARKTVTAAPAPQAKALPSLATQPGDADREAYRPAARTSAGVLGVARPHGAGPRPVVGLTGLEQSEPPSAGGSGTPGRPVVGGYLATRPGGEQPEPTAASPASPPASSSAEVAAPKRPAGYVLTLDTGERIEVTGPLVLGRMPSDAGGARAVPVADDSLSMSKTHAFLRPVDDGLEVVDRGSTNGTALLRDGAEHPLGPAESAVAQPGDTVRFGDRTAVVAQV